MSSTKEAGNDASPKRRQIVNAAKKLFLRDGFNTTSMDAVAVEANVSKATIYSHFSNKATLFAQVMKGVCLDLGDPYVEMDLEKQPQLVLAAKCRVLLVRLVNAIEIRMLQRVANEVPDFPEIGQVFWREGPSQFLHFVSEYLEKQNRRRVIVVADPLKSARYLMALTVGPYILPVLLGVEKPPRGREIDDHIRSVVSLFLRTLET